MKTSEKLYSVNAIISGSFIATQKSIPSEGMLNLNTQLGAIIKEVRQLEELLEECLIHIDNYALSTVKEACELLGHPDATQDGTHCHCFHRNKRTKHLRRIKK